MRLARAPSGPGPPQLSGRTGPPGHRGREGGGDGGRIPCRESRPPGLSFLLRSEGSDSSWHSRARDKCMARGRCRRGGLRLDPFMKGPGSSATQGGAPSSVRTSRGAGSPTHACERCVGSPRDGAGTADPPPSTRISAPGLRGAGSRDFVLGRASRRLQKPELKT